MKKIITKWVLAVTLAVVLLFGGVFSVSGNTLAWNDPRIGQIDDIIYPINNKVYYIYGVTLALLTDDAHNLVAGTVTQSELRQLLIPSIMDALVDAAYLHRSSIGDQIANDGILEMLEAGTLYDYLYPIANNAARDCLASIGFAAKDIDEIEAVGSRYYTLFESRVYTFYLEVFGTNYSKDESFLAFANDFLAWNIASGYSLAGHIPGVGTQFKGMSSLKDIDRYTEVMGNFLAQAYPKYFADLDTGYRPPPPNPPSIWQRIIDFFQNIFDWFRQLFTFSN